MGFRTEKFGAEEMEIKLFLFTVLQIRLFSPRSTGRGLLRQHVGGRGDGGARLFYRCINDIEVWTNRTAMCRGLGSISRRGCSMASSCAREPAAEPLADASFPLYQTMSTLFIES